MSKKDNPQRDNIIYDLSIVAAVAFSIWCWFKYDKGVMPEHTAKFFVCLAFFVLAVLNLIMTLKTDTFSVKGIQITKKENLEGYNLGIVIVSFMCMVCGAGTIYYAFQFWK